MKVNAKLGVTDKKDLLSNSTCFEAGLDTRRLQDALVFAGFLLDQKTKLKLSKNEIQMVSAGIHTAANLAASRFERYGEKKEAAAKAIASSAKRLNKKVREYLLPKSKMTEADGVKIRSSYQALVKKVDKLQEDIGKLCVLEKKSMAGPLPVLRATLGASAVVPQDKPQAPAVVDVKKISYPSFSRPAFHKAMKSIRRIP